MALERAAHRLSRTADPVIDVALDAGYRAPEAFARAFTRAYGCSPSRFRRDGSVGCQLAAANGIHFHPPAAIRIPAAERSTSMDVTIAMLDHHLSLVAEILQRADGLPAPVLDRPIELPVEGIDRDPTLRSLCERLVGQLEMWNAALDGEQRIVRADDARPGGLRERLAEAAPRFRATIVAALDGEQRIVRAGDDASTIRRRWT